MNTTIIILGAAILIVIIAIVVVLVGGKGSKKETPETDSSMTFKEDSAPQEVPEEIPEPQPQMATPELHQHENTPVPVQNPPVLNDLNTPIQSQDPVTSQPASPINQPNQLPNDTQMQNDMANLTNSMNQPNTAPNIPSSEGLQSNDIKDIANTINTQTTEPIDNTTTTLPINEAPVNTKSEVPVSDFNTTDNTQNQAATIPSIDTPMTPMEKVIAPVDLDTAPTVDINQIPQPTPQVMKEVSDTTNPIPPIPPV